MFDAVHGIRSLYKLLSSYQGRNVFRTLSNIEDWAFYRKSNALMQLCNQNFFRAGEVVELGYFDKHFVKNTQSALAGKDFRIFFLGALKTTFWKENLTQRWANNRGGLPSPPREAAVIVAEYASISLNIPNYPWKCLNKLFWLYQGSGYVWSSYMFNRLLKMPQVLHVPGFWIWHSCICKGYAEFDYTSICLNNPWICLIML